MNWSNSTLRFSFIEGEVNGRLSSIPYVPELQSMVMLRGRTKTLLDKHSYSVS